MTQIPNPVQSAALARPDHPALLWGQAPHQRWTFAELREQVVQRAASLRERGIGEGAVVALLGAPTPEWTAAFHAIGWVGAVAMPLAADASDDEIQRCLRGASPDFVWVAAAAERAMSAGAEGVRWSCYEKDIGASTPQETWWALEDVRVMLHTSGTTGAPRTIELTTGQLLFSAMGSCLRLGHHLDDVWLNCLPLHHTGGLSMLLRCAWQGTTLYLSHPFQPAVADALIEAGRVTQISVVPTMLKALLDQRGERRFPESLRVLLTGGAPCDEGLLERARQLKAPVSLTWGMTESASQIATCLPGDLRAGVGSGAPLPFVRVDDSEPCLKVTGPLVATGQLRTADVGTVDRKGHVHVERRSDRILISGGENIDPVEIEATLRSLEGIAEAAVVDVPHPRWGQRPVAFVVGDAPGGQLTLAALKEACGACLPALKIPERFYWLDALPTTSLGKVAYGRLRERARSGGEQPEAVEVGAEFLGDPTGREALKIDHGVHQPDGGAEALTGPGEGVVKGDRALADLLDPHRHQEPVSHAHGGLEVGLGVDKGHAPAAVVKDRGQAIGGGHEHLFEGGVAILKDPSEERDAGAVHFVESDGDPVFETHHNSNVSVREALVKTNP